MQDLLSKIEQAKVDNAALESLLAEYLPFIRQEAGKQVNSCIDYDDRVSIAMLVFMNCVRQYQAERGNFLAYVAVSIRNRLIDEGKKQARLIRNSVPLETEDDESNVISFEEKAAVRAYANQRTQMALAEEIEQLSLQLEAFGVEFSTLDTISPKHTRLRRQCIAAARCLAETPAFTERLVRNKRLPITQLSQATGMPVKTLEKCRKYIVTIAIIILGDYLGIQEFIPLDEGE